MNTKSTIVLILIITSAALSGCVSDNEITGYTVDVGFRDGSYQQYNNVVSYDIVHEGYLSDTVDLQLSYGSTTRLHYVTSIDRV